MMESHQMKGRRFLWAFAGGPPFTWPARKKNTAQEHHDRLVIGKFCSIACGARFLFTSANHAQASLSTYPFPIFFEEWGLDVQNITSA